MLAALAALALCTAPAAAATFKVTKHGDPNPGTCTQQNCSLREAIRAANARMGADRVVLPDRKHRYELHRAGIDDGGLTGDLDITNDPLRIVHPGKGRATIDANGIDRVFEAFSRATFDSLTITGGKTDLGDDGGGVYAQAGSATFLGSRVAGNEASGGNGAGIAANENLDLTRTIVAGNRITGAGSSSGGGIDALGDSTVIKRSRVTGNRSTGDGGALYLGGSLVKVLKSTLAGNRSAATGGGIHMDANGPLVINGSTLSDNVTSGDGGGIANYSDLVITNSTLSGNRASQFGGGIYDGGNVQANAITVARNVADSNNDDFGTGGGLYYPTAVPGFEIRNSLIALNRLGGGTRNDCFADPSDPLDSKGHNLLSTRGPSGSCLGFNRQSDRVKHNPRIKRLAKNGGPTKTIALKRRSAAINHAGSRAPKRDQRGVKRHNPDIGAFERR